MQEHRFRAEIRRQGPNPYVDVPARVSAALAPHAQAGRVPVEGTLRGAAFRATLIPVGGGRQRLYLAGGVRAAAGVGLGDSVEIALHAVDPDEVTVPADLAAALAAADAGAAFEAFTPAHRRQLLRFLDDARTPATRVKRVGQVVDQALGRPAAASSRSAGRSLWTCPACGNQFVNRNQYHACATYQIDDCFRGKPPEIRALFDAFRAMVEACGPVTVVAYSDRVAFMVDVRFAQATPRQRWLDVGFWLSRRVDSPRFWRVETIYPYAHVHVLRVTSLDQLDSEVAGWAREAYAIGRREHLAPSSSGPRDPAHWTP